jgi:polyphosphate kinase
MSALCELGGVENLLLEPWKPQLSPELATSEPMFDIVARHPVLIYQPFDSFESVVRFLNEAADDPDVLAIKQVLYRTSSRSPVTAALMRAAEKGKYVTALVELKARFDEARNIEWAQELEDSGVQVIYGVKRLKTHTKICLVIRREPGGLRRYMHFGTGNYNEKTARLYTDVSYLTIDEDLGADASAFFNAVSGYSQPQKYLKLEAAPTGLRDRIIELRKEFDYAEIKR